MTEQIWLRFIVREARWVETFYHKVQGKWDSVTRDNLGVDSVVWLFDNRRFTMSSESNEKVLQFWSMR